MLDKISNQKLFFISLIGIVVTSLILTTTFAYQSIRVNYSDGSDSEVSIDAGTLDVKYCRDDRCLDPNNTDKSEEKYNKIDVNNLSFLPDYKTASYVEFVVDNRSSTDDVAYMISLTDLVYNKMFVSEAFKYTVVVVNEDGTLNEINTGNFSTLTGNSFDLNLEDRIYKYIEKGKTERVRIYLWLDENVDVQLDLSDAGEVCLEATENKSSRCFKGTVNVSSIFEGEIANPLLYRRLINSAKLATKNNDQTRTVYNDTFDLNNITGSSSKNDKMLALAEDDYGTSYVYRGNVKDNYVNFAGFTWRIVRVNGDGSIRLILDGVLSNVNGCTNESVCVDSSVNYLESQIYDNGHVGYMYGDFGEASTSYDNAHKNINDSTIKQIVDNFYEIYLLNYNSYLSDTLFCGDKTLASFSVGSSDARQIGFGNKYKTYYASIGRLYYSEGTTYTSNAIPTLKCASSDLQREMQIHENDVLLTDEQLVYSRYTVDEYIINNRVKTNGDLKYPIALLSADELVMAGMFLKLGNDNLYFSLSNSNLDWWTMTPFTVTSSQPFLFFYTAKNSLGLDVNATHVKGVRPVINLKSSLLWDSGDGTKDNPYEVKLSE